MSIAQFFKKCMFRLYFKLFSILMHLRGKYGQANIIKDKILSHSPFFKKSAPPFLPALTENFGNEMLNRLKKILDEKGDYDYLINGYFSLTGKTSTCGTKKKSLSKLMKDSRLYASAFWNAGLRKGKEIIFLIFCAKR